MCLDGFIVRTISIITNRTKKHGVKRPVDVITSLHYPDAAEYQIVISKGIAAFTNIALKAYAERDTELMVF